MITSTKTSKSKNKIIKILKDIGLYEYYKNKDVDIGENEDSIFLIDSKVLKDDIYYILNNQEEYVNTDSVFYDEEIEFINKIKELESRLKVL